MKAAYHWFALVLVGCSIVTTVRAQTAQQIAQNSFPSVVLLIMEDANGQPVSLGSGFFVAGGVVATNLHVIEGAARGSAKLIGQKSTFDIAGTIEIHSRRDLVLLAVPGAKAPALRLGDSSQVTVGDEVYVVGNPQGLEGTFSRGIVSAIRQVGSDTMLQITAPISPGSSGGPVLNAQGEVIGVAVATLAGGQNLNFVIPSSYLDQLTRGDATSVIPLSGNIQSGRERSILSGFGQRSTERVVGAQMSWDSPPGSRSGQYSFSLRNQLSTSVKNVYCLVIFYDPSGNPLDVDVVLFPGVIPAGLARRIESKVAESVERINTPPAGLEFPPRPPKSRVEFRILDFKFVE